MFYSDTKHGREFYSVFTNNLCYITVQKPFYFYNILPVAQRSRNSEWNHAIHTHDARIAFLCT